MKQRFFLKEEAKLNKIEIKQKFNSTNEQNIGTLIKKRNINITET